MNIFLVFLLFVTGLLAIPSVQLERRALPCAGIVTSFDITSSGRIDNDGQSVMDYTSRHEIKFTNPVTLKGETRILEDISYKEGQSVPLLYDPKDGSLDINSFWSIHSLPLKFLAWALGGWFMLRLAISKLSV